MADCPKERICKNSGEKCWSCWTASSLFDPYPWYINKDLVEVVRCKNCYWWHPEQHHMPSDTYMCGKLSLPDVDIIYTAPDFFCGFGKKKDGGADG